MEEEQEDGSDIEDIVVPEEEQSESIQESTPRIDTTIEPKFEEPEE